MLNIRNAGKEDFETVFDFVQRLWTYNTYDREKIRGVYQQVLENDNDFAFLMFEEERPIGFCHGAYFNTFWLSGMTCYVSSIIVDQGQRRQGYGRALMDRAKELAAQKGCRALVLDSGMPRTEAHAFYEAYGFVKCALCFEYPLAEG